MQQSQVKWMCTHFFLTLGNEGNAHEVKDGKVEGKISLDLAQERTKGLKRVTVVLTWMKKII